MPIQLFLNDQQVELEQDETIAVDYAIAEIGKIQTRTSARSIAFKLTKTMINKTILENPGQVNNSSTLPYTQIKARLFVDGIDQQLRFAEIVSAKKVFRIRLYGSNVDFFQSIKGLKLCDLDLSDHNHFFNVAEVDDRLDLSTGAFYPVTDFHADSPNSFINNTPNMFWDVRFTFPAVYLETIITQMIKDAGFTANGDILTNQNYLDTYVQCQRLRTKATARAVLTGVFFFKPGDTFRIMTEGTLTGFVIKSEGTITLENSSTGTKIVGAFTSDKIVTTAIDFINPDVIIFDDDPQVEFSSNSFNGWTSSGNYILTLDWTIENTNALANTIKIYTRYGGGPAVLFHEGGFAGADPDNDDQEGAYNGFLDVACCLPDLSQTDIFRLFLQMFGQIVEVNNDTKVIRLRTLKNIIDNIPNAEDWTDKVDPAQKTEVKFKFSNYGQVNTATYEDDETVEKPDGTDSSIDIPNATLKEEFKLFESPFAATEVVDRFGGHPVPHIKDFDELATTFSETEPRILIVKRILGSFRMTDGTNQEANAVWRTGRFIESGQSFNLGWEDSLLPTFSQEFIDILQAIKIINELIRLNPSDINQLDFFIPVWIKEHNSYFYISKIKAFKSTSKKSTVVELVKL